MYAFVLTSAYPAQIIEHLTEVHGIKMPEHEVTRTWLDEFHLAQHDGGYSATEHEHVTYGAALRLLNAQGKAIGVQS